MSDYYRMLYLQLMAESGNISPSEQKEFDELTTKLGKPHWDEAE